MAQVNTTATLDGLFKIVYGEGPIKAIPEVSIVQKEVKFQATEKIGKSYNFPVILSCEAGVTYLAAGAGVQTLNDSIAAQVKEASVDANQIIIRGQMDYEAAAKATSGGEAAFKNASELLVENLMETGSRRLEMAFLYGQSSGGLGASASSANASTTQTVVTFTAASWAPGLWAGTENALIEAWKVSDNTQISSAANGVFTIVSVDYTNKAIRVNGTTTGITALDAATTAGVYFTWKGAKTGTSTWVEPVGIDKIISNTGSLFGIDASVYALWAGSTATSIGAPTVAKMLNAVGLAVSKGGLMEEAACMVSPKFFQYMAGTMTDLRRQNGGQKETSGMGGYEAITLMGPNGKLNITVHPMLKEGEFFIVPFKRFKRIGTQEFSFETPGRKGELFLHIPDKNAYELRLYGAQAIICTHPAKCVKGSGVTYP
ncbi:hypothetical protein [Bdellovibrio sp. HCB288]|uniref:hypothetical protein n=1 Tax=Bdellovibrio sp. HCB288 TaxID=3394355 RepID=UPI0039B3EB00